LHGNWPGAVKVSAVEAVALSPMGRIGRPEEIAAAVSWLISPEASFVAGGDFAVTGGF
jgi:NAD(P)-dependent dehydrogenase (short-subunit alcohol dehydrogenase family)